MAWTIRKQTSQARLGARLQAAEPRVNTHSPILKTFRLPIRSAVDPARIKRLAITTV